MRPYVTHILSRAKAALTNPGPLAMLILCALVSMFFWPGVLASASSAFDVLPGDSAPFFITIVLLTWLALLPTLLAGAVRPRAVGSSRSEALIPAHPVLPISIRSRMMIEAAVALGLLGLIRWLGIAACGTWLGGGTVWGSLVSGAFLPGALLILPLLLVNLGQSTSQGAAWAKTVFVAVAIILAIGAGLTSTVTKLAAVSLALAAVVLWIGALDLGRTLRVTDLFARAGRLKRTARDPERQLRIDFLLTPLPFLGVFVAAEAIVVLLRAANVLNGLAVYYLSTLVFSLLFGTVVLRPMSNPQAVAGVFGKAGYAPGDFGRAFAQLPLPRSLLARTVYLHGFISASLVWLGIVFVAAVNTRIALGEWLFFTNSHGELEAEIMVPIVVMIPIAAGFLVECTVGRRSIAMMTGALLLLAPQIIFVMLILRVPHAVQAIVIFIIAAAGGLPALRHCTRRGAEGTPLVTVIP